MLLLPSPQVVTELWPNAKRAAQWHLDRSVKHGIPTYLITTYDILGLGAYPFATYNGAFHLLAMRAATELALLMGEFIQYHTLCSANYW